MINLRTKKGMWDLDCTVHLQSRDYDPAMVIYTVSYVHPSSPDDCRGSLYMDRLDILNLKDQLERILKDGEAIEKQADKENRDLL